jgi:hypothetical protein
MSKATTKEVRALLESASEMFDETGCVPGIDGEEVRAETIVPMRRNTSGSRSTTRKYSATRRHGIDRGLRLSFRGWRKNGFRNATSSHLAAIKILSSISPKNNKRHASTRLQLN